MVDRIYVSPNWPDAPPSPEEQTRPQAETGFAPLNWLQRLYDGVDVGALMPETYAASSPVKDPLSNLLIAAGRGFLAPGRALKGEIPMWDMDPETGEFHPSREMMGAAGDMATLSMTGGVGGTGSGGFALGAGPVRKSPLLDMAQEARMARAAEQGYDTSTPLYHGTSKDADFQKFKDSRHGTWTTTDPEVASMYAKENDSKNLVLDHSAPGYQYKQVNSADRVLPLYGRPLENPFTGGPPESLRTATNYKKAQSDWFDQLRGQGHDGVEMPGGVRVDFNNANLRSVNAPFNPANSGKSMILGSGGSDARGAAVGTLASDIAKVSHDPAVLRAIQQHAAENPRAVVGGNYPPEASAMEAGRPAAPVVDEFKPLRELPPAKAEELPAAPRDPLHDLTVNDILHPDTPKQKPRSRDVEAIAKELETRGSEALKKLGVASGKVDMANPDHGEIVSRAMAAEIKAAMERGGNVATDWYTKAIDEAMHHASEIWPELKNNPHQKMGFTAALAVTSQGETVSSNARLAEIAYDHFRKTGKFPTNIVAKNGGPMNDNFQKLNDLIEAHGGLEGARDFLHQEFTVKDLKNMGYDPGSENVATKVFGSSILGPKIGQGFYQNLNGNYNPVTMDLWFMRGMGRLTGSLVGRDMAKPTARFRTALTDSRFRAPLDPEKLAERAEGIVKVHEKDFKDNRALYDSGEKQKSELTKSAERYLKNLRGINEQPTSGSHRNWMRDRVNRARELLAEDGHHLTNADLQAIWWYPEKELYSKLGGRDSEAINTDYATVFRDLRARRAAAQAEPVGPVVNGP